MSSTVQLGNSPERQGRDTCGTANFALLHGPNETFRCIGEGRVSGSHKGHAAGTRETTTRKLCEKRRGWDRISYRVGRAVVPEPNRRGWNRLARKAGWGCCACATILSRPSSSLSATLWVLFFFLVCGRWHGGSVCRRLLCQGAVLRGKGMCGA